MQLFPKETFKSHSWYPYIEEFIKHGFCELPNEYYSLIVEVLERIGYGSKDFSGNSEGTTILRGNMQTNSDLDPFDDDYADMSAAEYPLAILGGKEFTMMTGSSHYAADGYTLRMHLVRNMSRANRLHIIDNQL